MRRSPWVILGVLFLARTAMALQFQSVAALTPAIVEALHIDHARLGTLIGLYMLPGLAIAPLGGVAARRFGARRLTLLALALMAAGGAGIAAADSFTLAATSRLAAGVGGVALNVLLAAMVTDWFVNRRLATAMGVFVSSYPLGTALALVVCPALAARGSWRAAMLLTAAAALACLVLVGAVYREPPGAPGRAAGGAAISLSRREAVLVSLAGLVWTAYNASYLVLVSFAPDLLTARGYSVTAAAMLVSIAGWICLPTGPVGGYVADRLGRPDFVLGGAFAVMTFGMGAFVALDVEVAAFVIVAVAFAVAPGLIMALPADVLRPVNRAAGMGLYYTWYYAGVATLPAVAGLARDASESRAAPILVAALLACLAAVCALAFRATQRRTHPASGPQPVAGP